MRNKMVACFLAGLLTVSVLLQPGGRVLATERLDASGVTSETESGERTGATEAEPGEGAGAAEAESGERTESVETQPGTAEAESVEGVVAGNEGTAVETPAEDGTGEAGAGNEDGLSNAALPTAEGQDKAGNVPAESNFALKAEEQDTASDASPVSNADSVTEEQDGNMEEPVEGESPSDPDQETPVPDGESPSGESKDSGNAVEGEENATSESDSGSAESAIQEQAADGMGSVPAGEEIRSDGEAGGLVAHAEDDIASGSYGNVEWVIDASGKLTVNGTGDYAEPGRGYSSRSPWYGYVENITSAVINVTGMTDASYMFYDCRNMVSIDVSNFDTSSVTNMSRMFSSCSSLTGLNLENFKTSNVTDMSSMFSSCSSLTGLNLESFDTGNVTDMSYMFSWSRNLASLDLGSFHTDNVTNMSSMFSGCYGLMSLNLDNFDTSNVTSMSSMFSDCSSLMSLNLDSFVTSNVTSMNSVFLGCSSLVSLNLGNFDTSNVVDMSHMFFRCSSLASLDLGKFNTGNVMDMSSMFFGCSGLASLELGNFNTANVVDMSSMFSGCMNLTALNLGNFDASHATSMSSMFDGCYYLTTIHTPYHVSQSVSLPMVEGNIAWHLADGTVVAELPQGLDHSVELKRYEIQDEIANGSYKDTTWSIDADRKLTVSGTGDYAEPGEADETRSPWYEYRELITSAEINVTGMTDASYMFSGCNNMVSIDVSHFDTSHIMNMRFMFSGCSSVTSLDLGNFDTSNVTDMDDMFWRCSSLTSLDLGSFDTSNVTDMAGMFYSCDNLTSLNIKNFNTSNVTDMQYMFSGCSSLTDLNLENFDTGNVTDMGCMFDLCSSLTSLNVDNFNTSSVTGMWHMFDNCSNLTSIDVGSFDTSNVTNMWYMFSYCSNLTSLDLNNFDTSNVTDMSGLFDGCYNITKINAPYNVAHPASLPTAENRPWRLPDGTEVTQLPQGLDHSVELKRDVASGSCQNITWAIDSDGKLTVNGTGDYKEPQNDVASNNSEAQSSRYEDPITRSGIDVSVNDEARSPWYEYRDRITTAEINVSGMTDASYLFYKCSNLTSVDFSSFDTSRLKNMWSMFSGCSALTSLDLGGFDTSNVTVMGAMFSGCSSLADLNLGTFSTGNVTNMWSMFSGCSGLARLDLSNFDTSNVTDMWAMFSGCSGLAALDLKNFTTSNVTDMEYMFSGCSALASLDLSNFDTSKAKDTRYMFSGCDNLETIKAPKTVGAAIALPAVYADQDGSETVQLTSAFAAATLTRTGNSPDHIISTQYKEIQEALATEEVKTIDYVLPDGQNVPYPQQNEIFTALQGSDKTMSFVFQDEAGKTAYSWTFAGGEVTDPSKTVEFQITIDAQNQEVLEIVPSDMDKVDLEFLNEGVLPGRANIRVAAASYFTTDRLYLYYYNPEGGALELVDDNVSFDGNFASFFLDHNSNYVLTAAMLKTLLPERPEETQKPAESPQPPTETPQPPAETPKPPVETPAPQSPADSSDTNNTNTHQGAGNQENTSLPLQYTVLRGDTLSRLARTYRTTIARLLSLNPVITNPNRIYIGQVLMVDGSVQITTQNTDGNTDGNSGRVETGQYHIVRGGDSFYKIGRMYGIPLKNLLDLNPDMAKQRYIYPGQQVLLRPKKED